VTRSVLGLLVLVPLAACGAEPTRPPAAEPTAKPAAPAAADGQVTMSGVDLYLHDTRPTLGTPRRPAFWVRAEELVLVGEGRWAFEKAHAVIAGRDEAAEDILLDAAQGRFREEEGAVLEGGGVAHVGTMTMEFESIEWDNANRQAWSDKPVKIVDGKTHLDASSLRLYPDERRFELTDVRGVIYFERNEP